MMNPEQNRGLTAHRQTVAFSLVELLVVMLIASVLIGASGPAMVGLLKGNQMNGAVSEMAGVLEQARQYAVSNNTYVWVAFSEGVRDGVQNVNMAVLASKSGSDPTSWNSFYGLVPSSDIEVIGKPRLFPGVILDNAGVFTSSLIRDLPDTTPGVTDQANSPANSTSGLFSLSLRGNAVMFTRTIQFTPSGEVRKSSSPTNLIEFALRPALGNQADVAVVRINGLTGQTVVYRP